MEKKGNKKKIRNVFSLKRVSSNNPGPDEHLMLVRNQQKELKKPMTSQNGCMMP